MADRAGFLRPALRPSARALTYLWAGVVLGISFLEAPIKFRAPSLSYSVALDVGRHVFFASECIQLGFAAIIALLSLRELRGRALHVFVLAVLALLLQRFALYPLLEARALAYLNGQTPGPSATHVVYVIVEIVKLAALLSLAHDHERGDAPRAEPSLATRSAHTALVDVNP